MKGLLPSLRKWKSGSPENSTKKSQNLEKLQSHSRSLDENIESKDKIDSRGYYLSTKTRSYSDEARLHFESLSLSHPSVNFTGYNFYSDGQVSPDDYPDSSLEPLREDNLFIGLKERTARRGILKQSSLQDLSPGNSPVQTEFSEMVDQDDIIALTRHVRNFADSLNILRETFALSNGGRNNPEEVKAQAHQQLGSVLSILKGVLEKYPAITPKEILMSAGIVIKKVKEHDYSSAGEPIGFFEATDQLALAFSSSVSDYLMGDQDMSQNLGTSQSDMGRSFENLKSTETGYDEEEDKRDYLEDGREFLDSYEYQSERAESEESLDRIGYEAGKQLPFGVDAQANSPVLDENEKQAELYAARKDSLDKALLSIEGSVDISLQRTKVWSKYAKDIINYMERRANIELDYCKQLSKLAQATKPGIMEESCLPFQSCFATSLEDDLNYAANCQKKLQQELRGTIVKMLTSQRNEHDRIRSKLKEKWAKECKKLNDSVINLKKAKSMYIQKQQELEKFVDKQDSKEELNANSSVVPSFSIGKKKKEEDIAKKAEEAEEHYRKCVDEANNRQKEVERIRECILLDLRELVYQCDMTMKEVTCHFFQLMKSLSAPLRVQYQTLAEDSKQYVVGNQFAEFIKIQQTTSKPASPKRFTFELYVADEKNDPHKGYIGPADIPSPRDDQGYSPQTSRRRISTISAGSDTSLNRPSSPVSGRRHRNAWGPPNRNSNSDDTGSVSSRSLPGSPTGSPKQNRKDKSQRYSLGQNDLESREILKKEPSGPFRNLNLSQPALSHKFKKLRSSSKCKNCDSYVYFNGAECEHCGLTCHKKCLETLAIKCGRSRLPRKMTTFGVDFHKHLDATHRENIPLIMEKCIAEVDARCLQVKGLYRLSGVKTKVEVLSQQFETAGEMVDLSTTNPNLITSVLKLYLRELPESLMTFDLYPTFIQIAKESTGLKFNGKEDEADEDHDEENDARCEDCLHKLHDCIRKLPHANYFTVVRLFKHLRRVANNEVFNQMSVSNLAIIFGPTLLRPRGSPSSLSALMDMTHQARVVELLILNSQILDDDFLANNKIEEEEQTSVSENSQTTNEIRQKSENDLNGYSRKGKEDVSKEDSVGNEREELSFSDELQMNFPLMFQRTESGGKDISSSLGSLDGMSDLQSPDIEEELKDLVQRGQKDKMANRPSNLIIEKCDRPPSPVTVLSAGSESNVSFSSLSPVDLPDTSMDVSSSDLNPDLENEAPAELSTKSPSPTKMVLEGLKLEAIIVTEESDVNLPEHEDVKRPEEEVSPRRTRRKGYIAITTAEKQTEDEICKDKNKDEACDVAISSSYESLNATSQTTGEKHENTESESQKTEIDTEIAKLKTEDSPTKPRPRVAPKPLSPVSSLNKDNFVSKYSDEYQPESKKEDSENCDAPCGSTPSLDDKNKPLVNISGNTRKLRDRFSAVLDGTDSRSENEVQKTPTKNDKFPSRQSSFELEGNERHNKEISRKGSNNTAKLVEKFSRESDKKKERNSTIDDSPLSPRGVSVKKMLKQFESGDEMDDEDGETKRKHKVTNKESNEENVLNTYRDSATLKHGSSPIPISRKSLNLSHSSDNFDDRIRVSADNLVKREPKFV